jgi:hypothetical protein
MPRTVSKYSNQWTAGYASKKEADYAMRFQALARGGEISDYHEQLPITIVPGKGKIRPVIYIADFVYTDDEGIHYCDAKGFKTPVYLLKKRLLLLLHGIEIEEL